MRRHESLRTTFAVRDGEPVQVIHPDLRLELPVADLSGLAKAEHEARSLAREEALRSFDLRNGPLMRLALLRLGQRDWLLFLTMHHIVSDGWSMGVLLREIAALHAAFSAGRPSPLPELPVQSADFAVWQRSWLQGEVLDEQLSFWTRELAGAPQVLELPTDRPRPAVQTFRGASHPVALPPNLAGAVRDLSHRQGATPFMVLLAAWGALLGRLADQDELLVGTPVAGRSRQEIEGLIGCFVNTLVLRTELAGEEEDDASFGALLERVRRRALDAYAHQDLPFERLVEVLVRERDLSRAPLFQVLFALQNASGEVREIPGLTMRPVPLEDLPAKFDLALTLAEGPAGLAGFLDHNLDLFDDATAERLAARFAALLAAAVAEPGHAVRDLPVLLEGELAQVLRALGGARCEYPREVSLPELFATVVAEAPAAPAVVEEDGETWSYLRLAESAHRLARHLAELGVGPGDRVGVALERSAGLVASLLAVLELGAAYVPLDPASPDERLAFLLADASARLVLVHAPTRQRMEDLRSGLCVVDVGEDRESGGKRGMGGEGIRRRGERIPAEALAYVIYTSGSTGRPKGVTVPHRAVARLVWGADDLALRRGDRLAFNASPAFDAATFEIWGTLLRGATLVVIGRETLLSPAALAERLRRERVTVLHLTTALFNRVAHEAPEVLSPLRLALFGGEASDPAAVAVALRQPPERLLHTYGPTESTTFAAWHRVTEVPPEAATVPIGRPLANTSLVLLDRRQSPVPPGVPGELCIGGAGLAWGYWDRPDLTAERFIPHSWEPGERLYRTGDRVRRRSDGALEFLGRLDDQVKIRGYRIEPGEVEAALLEHPAVREAVVLACEEIPGDRRLVAWVVLHPTDPTDPKSALRAWLQKRLPDYMVPAGWVLLESLPLTANGKVDRRALPAPERAPSAVEDHVAPSDPLEEILAAIWAEVLKLDRVGVRDDFFALGGHSLLATQMVSRIRGVLGNDLPLRTLFEAPTIAQLARAVREGRTGPLAPPIVPVPRPQTPIQPELPLSFAQQRLWLLDQLEPGTAVYNIPSAVRLSGDVAPALLVRVFAEVLRRHEALRTTFARRDGGPVQIIALPGVAAARLQLPLVDLAGLPEAEREAEASAIARQEAGRSFDLEHGPLLRLLLVRLGGRDHLLLLTLHHIVSDGWSAAILIREVAAVYQAFSRKQVSPLPELPVQYADFACWQRAWLQGEVLERQIAYWRDHLEGAPRVLALPTDLPRPAASTVRGAHQMLEVPVDLYAALRALSRREGVTLFMTLLAAFEILLSHLAGQTDFIVGANIANRNRAEVEDLIGFFVNLLPLRADLTGDPGFRDVLARVREAALGAYAHQDAPFELVVQELKLERELGRIPLVQVVFTFQTASPGLPELPGLALSGFDAGSESVPFDLSLAASDLGDRLSCNLQYRTDLFYAPTIAQLLRCFDICLRTAVEEPEVRLTALAALFAEESARQDREAKEKLNRLRLDRSRPARPKPVRAQAVAGEG